MTNKKKREYTKSTRVIGILFFIVLLFSFFVSAASGDVKPDDVSTWAEDYTTMREISSTIKNEEWPQASDFIRDIVLNQAVNDLRKARTQGVKLPFIGEVKGTPTEPLTLKGFEKSGVIQWQGESGLMVKVGGVFDVDLEKIPAEVTQLEYIPAKEGSFAQLKYTLKDGSIIVIEGGKLNEDLSYTSDAIPTSLEEKGKMWLLPGKGEIRMGPNGEIDLAKGAQIKIGERTFSQVDTTRPAELGIIEGSWFAGKNLKVQTNDFLVRSDADTVSHFIFKKDFNDKIVGTGESVVKIYDEGDTKNVYLSGKNIEIEPLNKEMQKMTVITKGENIVVKNGENIWITKSYEDGSGRKVGLYTKRTIGSADVNAEITPAETNHKTETNVGEPLRPPVINEGTPVSPPGTEKAEQGTLAPPVVSEGTPSTPSTGTDTKQEQLTGVSTNVVKVDDTKFVCVG
ncbi:MAG: hypothetical protein RL557_452, partial [archaeon]